MGVELGKITAARFGLGGRDDELMGLALSFTSGKGGTVSDFLDVRAEERAGRIKNTMQEAQVRSVSDLVGTPVEITFDRNMLQSWRILTEVI